MTDSPNHELPPLPVRHITREDVTGSVLWETEDGPYSADQMREYAQAYAEAAVLAERERCAKLCETYLVETPMGGRKRLSASFPETQGMHDGQVYAAAIRDS